MSLESATRRGREFIEKTMISECRIKRRTGSIKDPQDNLKMIDTFDIIYEGKCRIKLSSAVVGVSEREGVGEIIALQENILSIPVASPDTAKNDLAEITVNPLDPGLVGREFRVKGEHESTSVTARRLAVEGTN
jgi:hypothetical protein